MRLFFTISFIALSVIFGSAQEDLLSLLEEEEEEETVLTSATWKTTRVINLHTTENVAAGGLDFRISHRFGFVNQGAYEFFGLDNATIRLGLEMGLTDRLMAGFGRSSYQKTFDGFLKYKLVRQSTGKKNVPIAISAFASATINTLKNDDPDIEVLFSSRMAYAFQVIFGRKFSPGFSAQITPTLIHRNLVETTDEENDVFAFGFAARQKISKRVTINAEYIYVLPDQISTDLYNSFSIGVDIETGGHVFQLHCTNSSAMVEKGFVAENVGNFWDGDIHFGFNISRVFNLWVPGVKAKKPKKEKS